MLRRLQQNALQDPEQAGAAVTPYLRLMAPGNWTKAHASYKRHLLGFSCGD
jgi:hypothetical protein